MDLQQKSARERVAEAGVNPINKLGLAKSPFGSRSLTERSQILRIARYAGVTMVEHTCLSVNKTPDAYLAEIMKDPQKFRMIAPAESKTPFEAIQKSEMVEGEWLYALRRPVELSVRQANEAYGGNWMPIAFGLARGALHGIDRSRRLPPETEQDAKLAALKGQGAVRSFEVSDRRELKLVEYEALSFEWALVDVTSSPWTEVPYVRAGTVTPLTPVVASQEFLDLPAQLKASHAVAVEICKSYLEQMKRGEAPKATVEEELTQEARDEILDAISAGMQVTDIAALLGVPPERVEAVANPAPRPAPRKRAARRSRKKASTT